MRDAPDVRDTIPFVSAGEHQLIEAGIDVNRLRQGLVRLLPLLEVAARISPSPLDDLVVHALRMLLGGKLELVPAPVPERFAA